MEQLIMVGVRVVEVLFFAGIIGSAIVVLITGVEDVETALGGGNDEHEAQSPKAPAAQH